MSCLAAFLLTLLGEIPDQARARQIDQQIEMLHDEANRHRAAALWYQDLGDRLQFDSDKYDEAREAWNNADRERAEQKEIEAEIEELQKERKELE